MDSTESVNVLKLVLSQVSSTSSNASYRIAAQIRNAKATVIERYSKIFSPENLPNLTPEDFRSFLLFKNNQHWDNLQRQSGMMTEDMPLLRNAIQLLINEQIPIKTRLDQLRPNGKDPMVRGLGRAVITAILQVIFPEKYGIWNNVAEESMKKLNLWPETTRNTSFGDRYVKMNDELLAIAKELCIDLWTLDMLWWRVGDAHTPVGSGASINAETDSSEITETPTIEINGSTDFGLEKYLHSFLEDNWHITDLAKEWELLEEDGEVVGTHYDTGEVGEIDLLAKHRTNGTWLVIELKKNQTSDATVGQVLRYMGWVRRNLATNGENVNGLVICHEVDRKLQYALDGLQNIKCMNYQVTFTLNPHPEL